MMADSTVAMSGSVVSTGSFGSEGGTPHGKTDSPSSPLPTTSVALPDLPTPDQMRIVRETWEEIKDVLTVGDHVYKYLYERSPQASQLFRRFNPQSQSRAFMVMLGYAVTGLHNPSSLIPNLLKLGRRHQVYNVSQSDYEAMQYAVMEVLSECFRSRWNGSVKDSWNAVFTYIAAVMMAGDPRSGDYANKNFSSHMEALRAAFQDVPESGEGVLAEFDGWLEKVSKSNPKKLSKRWIELRGGHLFYFREKTGHPSRVIDLSMNCHLEDCSTVPYAFTLVSGADSMTFAACGDIEKDTWWEKIQKRIKESKGSEKEKVVFQGDAIPSLGFPDFDVLKVLGRGSYGKVLKVRQKDTGEIFAMKVLKKESLIHLSKYRDMELKAEREILQRIEHPFIVHLHHAFYTDKKLCLVMDFLPGGVLLWHMNNRRHQPSKGLHDSQVQFYAAEVVSALQHLHSFGIIYRDLKPENLILDKDGHVVLTDFGLATTKGQGVMMCGSAPFMAPEIVKRQPYTVAVDWWSLGVLIYEMMSGTRLFPGTDNTVFTKILSYPIRFPPYFSDECKDLLRCMLTRDPAKRINGDGIMQHPWFSKIDFVLLVQKKIPPPFIPDISGSDTKYFNPCPDEESMAVQEPVPVPPPQASQAIKQLLEEFPHNSRVKVLSEDEYGKPLIAPDGSIRTDAITDSKSPKSPTSPSSGPASAVSSQPQPIPQPPLTTTSVPPPAATSPTKTLSPKIAPQSPPRPPSAGPTTIQVQSTSNSQQQRSESPTRMGSLNRMTSTGSGSGRASSPGRSRVAPAPTEATTGATTYGQSNESGSPPGSMHTKPDRCCTI